MAARRAPASNLKLARRCVKLVYPSRMQRFLRWIKRLSAFRIGLVTGLFFAAGQLFMVSRRVDLPILTKFESALGDLKFKERGFVDHGSEVVVAAADEAAIAKFGRVPWDRRVIASLVDKLTDEGAAVVAFDMSFSDEDLGGRFAGAKRFRTRFEEISLAAPNNKAAVDLFAEAETDVAGGRSALDGLSRSARQSPEFIAAEGRLSDGVQKLADSRQLFEGLVKQHAAYAAELDQDLGGLSPDQALGKALQRNGKSVVGWIALTPQELTGLTDAQLDGQVSRIAGSEMSKPEYSEEDQPGVVRARVIEPNAVKHYSGMRAPLRPIAEGASGFGFFTTLPDSDAVIRNVALVMEIRGHYLPSLEAMTFALRKKIPMSRVHPVISNPLGGLLAGVDFDGTFVPTDERGLLRINYFGKEGTFHNYSIADIVDGKTPPKAFAGRIVLVAATAVGTFDQRVTPLDKITAGVEIHANALETMLSRRFLQTSWISQLLEVLALVVMALVFALIFARVKVTFALPVLLIAGLCVHLASYGLFRAGWSVYEALPLIELASMFVLVTVFRYATEEKDKRQLRKAFEFYLNPEVMDEMLSEPERLKLGGEELEMSVLFSDIRGFTTISEKLSPQALVHLLNAYLSPMTDIVFAKRGTLDKYIGDAVMAFFGAPIQTEKHAANACDAALEMIETLARLREAWRIENPEVPNVDIGIGINSGPMVVGNMGSAQRFNYTVMGDNVNTASRLEGLNKEYGTHILISGATLGSARKAAGVYVVRELDSVAVKGKKEPVVLFELRGKGKPQAGELPLLEGYAEGLALYRAQRFSEARLQFESLLERFHNDGPCLLFLGRCDRMNAQPPGEGWDGVFKMEHK